MPIQRVAQEEIDEGLEGHPGRPRGVGEVLAAREKGVRIGFQEPGGPLVVEPEIEARVAVDAERERGAPAEPRDGQRDA